MDVQATQGKEVEQEFGEYLYRDCTESICAVIASGNSSVLGSNLITVAELLLCAVSALRMLRN